MCHPSVLPYLAHTQYALLQEAAQARLLRQARGDQPATAPSTVSALVARVRAVRARRRARVAVGGVVPDMSHI